MKGKSSNRRTEFLPQSLFHESKEFADIFIENSLKKTERRGEECSAEDPQAADDKSQNIIVLSP
jgi:hypothetical protein